MERSYLECTLSQGGYATCSCPDCSDLRSSQHTPLRFTSPIGLDVARSPSLSSNGNARYTYADRQSSGTRTSLSILTNKSPALQPARSTVQTPNTTRTVAGSFECPIDLTVDDTEANHRKEQTQVVTLPSRGPGVHPKRQLQIDLEPGDTSVNIKAAIKRSADLTFGLETNAREDYESALQLRDDRITELSSRLRALASRGADHRQSIWHKDRIIALRKKRIADLEVRERKLERDMRWCKDRSYDLEEENEWLRQKLRKTSQSVYERERATSDVDMADFPARKTAEPAPRRVVIKIEDSEDEDEIL